MSNTPRTQARVRYMIDNNISPEGLEHWANGLECELNAANVRIKQLEEALEATAMIIGPPGHLEWATDDEINRAWGLYIQTKEIKP